MANNLVTIYRVTTTMCNPDRVHVDLRADEEASMAYFDGVKRNPDCISLTVEKLQSSEDNDFLEVTEELAHYYREEGKS